MIVCVVDCWLDDPFPVPLPWPYSGLKAEKTASSFSQPPEERGKAWPHGATSAPEQSGSGLEVPGRPLLS